MSWFDNPCPDCWVPADSGNSSRYEPCGRTEAEHRLTRKARKQARKRMAVIEAVYDETERRMEAS